MGGCERAPTTRPVEQAPGEDGLVDLLLHRRLMPLDVVLLLLRRESELHVDLLGDPSRAALLRGEQNLRAAPFRPVGQTANSASVFRPTTPPGRPAPKPG